MDVDALQFKTFLEQYNRLSILGDKFLAPTNRSDEFEPEPDSIYMCAEAIDLGFSQNDDHTYANMVDGNESFSLRPSEEQASITDLDICNEHLHQVGAGEYTDATTQVDEVEVDVQAGQVCSAQTTITQVDAHSENIDQIGRALENVENEVSAERPHSQPSTPFCVPPVVPRRQPKKIVDEPEYEEIRTRDIHNLLVKDDFKRQLLTPRRSNKSTSSVKG